jgi:MFS family permease
MFTAACCFGGGFLVSALGVYLHQIWLLYLGYGVIGGIGLGLGYVSPVSTLIRWFPDRRGMATGMAIMGFGGGAMIAAPGSVALMNHFKSATSVGVAETFLVLGVLYFISMTIGALAIRIPPADWKPAGWTPPATSKKMITKNHVHIDQALKTPQFYLLWLVLFLNVTGVSCGRRRRTGSAARTPTSRSSRSARCCISSCRNSRARAISRSSCWPTASSCRCTAAASRRFPRISPTCSARRSSAAFTDGS